MESEFIFISIIFQKKPECFHISREIETNIFSIIYTNILIYIILNGEYIYLFGKIMNIYLNKIMDIIFV